MEEDRTADVWHDRVIIEAEYDQNIIEIIIAPQILVACRIRQLYKLVVLCVLRGIAPTVLGRNGNCWKLCHWQVDSVTTIQHTSHRPGPDRGQAISFDRLEANARPAQDAINCSVAI